MGSASSVVIVIIIIGHEKLVLLEEVGDVLADPGPNQQPWHHGEHHLRTCGMQQPQRARGALTLIIPNGVRWGSAITSGGLLDACRPLGSPTCLTSPRKSPQTIATKLRLLSAVERDANSCNVATACPAMGAISFSLSEKLWR